MSDQFSETTVRGYGSRMADSIKGLVFGLLMFLASFVLLYWNEGRVDVSRIARQAVRLDGKIISADPALQGSLVCVTGELVVPGMLGDGLFLKPGPYLFINRIVQVYAWREYTKKHRESHMGGSEIEQTTYTYVREWVEHVPDSAQFKYPDGHANLAKIIEGVSLRIPSAQVGLYAIDPERIQLPHGHTLFLTNDNTILSGQTHTDGHYVYKFSNVEGNFSTPQIGDMRISYNVVKAGGQVTAFGQLQQKQLMPHVYKVDHVLYRLFEGSRQEALVAMHQEYAQTTWILRLIGFLLMWFGLMAVLGPLVTLLDVVPLLGSLGRALTLFVTFAVAFGLSALIVTISLLVHSWTALIIVLFGMLVVLGIYVFIRGKKTTKRRDIV